MVNCKGEYEEELEHSEYIGEYDKNRHIIRCTGWRNPLNSKFVTKPPFLAFDISTVFRDELSDLSYIPYGICVYDDRHSFGGAPSYVSNRSHYVG